MANIIAIVVPIGVVIMISTNNECTYIQHAVRVTTSDTPH